MPFGKEIEIILLVGLIIHLLFQSWVLMQFVMNGGNGLSKYSIVRYLLMAVYLANEIYKTTQGREPHTVSVILLFSIFTVSTLTYLITLKETSITKSRGYGVRPITLADSQPIKRRSASGTREILLGRLDDSKPFITPHIDLKKKDGKDEE